jgi:ribonuclease E
MVEPISGPDGGLIEPRPTTPSTTVAAEAADPVTDGQPGAGGNDESGEPAAPRRRRRGSRGGRSRNRHRPDGESDDDSGSDDDAGEIAPVPSGAEPAPEPRRPRIGDTRPAPAGLNPSPGRSRGAPSDDDDAGDAGRRRRRRGGRGRGGDGAADEDAGRSEPARAREGQRAPGRGLGADGRGGEGRNGSGRGPGRARPVEMLTGEPLAESDPDTLERRRGRERKGRPVGRYLMCVHAQPQATQIAVLEGRMLIEHYVSRPQDDANQIDGNIYLGRVQNVLPGMEAAFIDIGTPKNAVLYRGDLRFDIDDVEGASSSRSNARIEQLLRPGQMVVCQVTKNPIAHKGARLTQEVSLPGRFVVLIPNSTTYGISKRLSDDERKRLRRTLDEVKPANHGLIVRTAAEGTSADELRRDVARLASQWERIDALAAQTKGPGLLYREPDLAVRVIREEFNKEYRGVIIDDHALYEDVRDYVASISPELADRVEYYDPAAEDLPLFERQHVHEQLHKAIDRKVWLPSGGSLIIERTEALTVIDVNTGKNVGTSNLEETVYRNNLEAADEIARQLRLRDIGGIIVIDFIDMEIAANRNDVVRVFRDALARDKTRTQVFDISELGLVEMTRKRVSEGLVESLSTTCPECEGRGIIFNRELLD